MENGIGEPYSDDLKSAAERYNKEKYPDEPVSSNLDIADALEIMEGSYPLELWDIACDTCIAWIKAELKDKQ